MEDMKLSHMSGNAAGDDSFIELKFEQDAKKYEQKYGDHVTETAAVYNESFNKYDRRWTMHDTVALGQYLESWDNYSQMFESDPTTRDSLGDYLRVGLGLAAIQYATLPASFLASVQPLNDEVGMVYFRELVATATRGGVTAGDVLGNIQGKLDVANMDNYYAESTSTTITMNDAGYYPVLLNAPIRTRTVTVTVVTGGNTYRGIDDGEGNLYGSWPVKAATSAPATGANAPQGVYSPETGVVAGNPTWGTSSTGVLGGATGAVNYTSTWNGTNGPSGYNFLINVAGATGTITVAYHTDLSQASTIPGFQYRLSSKQIRVNYFILENVYSTLADYAVRRRFGRALSDDIASAAVAQINAAVLSTMIKRLDLAGNTTGTVTWDARPDAAVSVYDHRRTFPDALEGAAQLIDSLTMRGAINFIIAGSYGRRIFQSLGVEMVRKPLPGPYLTGFWQNIPIFYAPASLVANDKCIVGYRGASWFEAPLVYAPFLPLVMVKGAGPNPFNRITGVAHAAGIDTVVEGFVAKIQITNMQNT